MFFLSKKERMESLYHLCLLTSSPELRSVFLFLKRQLKAVYSYLPRLVLLEKYRPPEPEIKYSALPAPFFSAFFLSDNAFRLRLFTALYLRFT